MTPEQFNALAGELPDPEPVVPEFMLSRKSEADMHREIGEKKRAARAAARRKAENRRFLKIALAVCVVSFALGFVLGVM